MLTFVTSPVNCVKPIQNRSFKLTTSNSTNNNQIYGYFCHACLLSSGLSFKSSAKLPLQFDITAKSTEKYAMKLTRTASPWPYFL